VRGQPREGKKNEEEKIKNFDNQKNVWSVCCCYIQISYQNTHQYNSTSEFQQSEVKEFQIYFIFIAPKKKILAFFLV
jgi:hypothetical protein